MLLPDRLRELRKAKNLSRKRLNELSKVSVRTIQRLEDPARGNTTPHGNTVEKLAKALQVDRGVLTGELPLPQADIVPGLEPRRFQIGVEIAPKAKLAYDLVKRRYGVSTTELVNMAPLFFALLAEGSLARRLEKLEEAREAIGRLDRMSDEVGHSIFSGATTVARNADMAEDESIAKADLFGEHLLGDSHVTFVDEPFDVSTENPFASHLRTLAADINRPGVVKVELGGLSYGRPWLRFPDYDLWDDELDHMTNDSPDARRALETGRVRLSEIPEDLKGEDAGKERAAWLEDRLPGIYKDLKEGQPMAAVAKFLATGTTAHLEELVKNAASESGPASRNGCSTEEEGDVQ